jgi:cobalt/nickel transport system permease protein
MGLFWWSLALALLLVALIVTRRRTIAIQRLPIAGVYKNLTPLIGMLAGPGIGLLIIFIVNLLSFAVGHGGWGSVGANTTVNLSEIAVAFYVFRITKGPLELFTRGAVAATAGLLVVNVVFRIVIWSGRQRTELQGIALLTYMIQILILTKIVAVGEAVVPGFVADYLSMLRPDLIGE